MRDDVPLRRLGGQNRRSGNMLKLGQVPWCVLESRSEEAKARARILASLDCTMRLCLRQQRGGRMVVETEFSIRRAKK